MCGRYCLFDDGDSREIWKMIEEISARYPNGKIKTGEIFPTDSVPVIITAGSVFRPELMEWGFQNYYGRGVVINARAETAAQKQMFKNCLMTGRCVVPSSGFYEWNHDGTKQKYRFRLSGSQALYMAGLCRVCDGKQQFVILTTASNDSMRHIHNRMPVVLAGNDRERWLSDPSQILRILSQTPPELIREECTDLYGEGAAGVNSRIP